MCVSPPSSSPTSPKRPFKSFELVNFLWNYFDPLHGHSWLLSVLGKFEACQYNINSFCLCRHNFLTRKIEFIFDYFLNVFILECQMLPPERVICWTMSCYFDGCKQSLKPLLQPSIHPSIHPGTWKMRLNCIRFDSSF